MFQVELITCRKGCSPGIKLLLSLKRSPVSTRHLQLKAEEGDVNEQSLIRPWTAAAHLSRKDRPRGAKGTRLGPITGTAAACIQKGVDVKPGLPGPAMWPPGPQRAASVTTVEQALFAQVGRASCCKNHPAMCQISLPRKPLLAKSRFYLHLSKN